MISQPYPEPICDLEAQVEALHDHANPKAAVYFAPHGPVIRNPSLSVSRPEGTISTLNENIARFYHDKPTIEDDDLALILGYPEAKSAIEKPIVLQARDAYDNVVQECAVSFKNVMPHSLEIARYVPRGGRLVIASLYEVLQRRVELR